MPSPPSVQTFVHSIIDSGLSGDGIHVLITGAATTNVGPTGLASVATCDELASSESVRVYWYGAR
jgi:hypothetical protein